MDFKIRGFISITLALSFIIICLSGIVLYIMPHGRVVYWTNWKIAGLSKDDWEAIHTILGYAFMIAAIVHACFNWGLFISYIKGKLSKGFLLKKEFAASLLFTSVLLWGTIAGIPPFGSIMDVGESFKLSWEKDSEKPPVPHAELMTLEKFIANLDLSTDTVMDNLENYGISDVNKGETLKTLASDNDISPHELYMIIHPSVIGGNGTDRDLSQAGLRAGQGSGKGLGLGARDGRGRRNRTYR